MSEFALPALSFSSPAESFTVGDYPPPACPPGARDQLGVVFFRQWVRSHIGGGDFGILGCVRPQPSDHFEGRAWDWANLASNPEDAARVEAMLAWLFANDWEMFRRLGLKYVIWNRRKYQGGKGEHYTGPNPHVDHVHFSFGWRGARGQTSFFPAAGFISTEPPAPTPSGPMPPGGKNPSPDLSISSTPATSRLASVFGAVLSAAAAYAIVRWLM